jgi:hypothetical protein
MLLSACGEQPAMGRSEPLALGDKAYAVEAGHAISGIYRGKICEARPLRQYAD